MRAAGARRVGPRSSPGRRLQRQKSGVQSPSLSSGPGSRPGCGRPVVLAVGRLAAQKGFGTSPRCRGALAGPRPALPLLAIAGDGPLAGELRARAASLGVDAAFLGHRDDVADLLAAATVFVLPSRWEGQPLILQEALRAGAAIVATRVGGIPNLVGDDAALLVPPGDAPGAGRRRPRGAHRPAARGPASHRGRRARRRAADGRPTPSPPRSPYATSNPKPLSKPQLGAIEITARSIGAGAVAGLPVLR
jgi:glycosyltransferase involved in cell wall biosynthesis